MLAMFFKPSSEFVTHQKILPQSSLESKEQDDNIVSCTCARNDKTEKKIMLPPVCSKIVTVLNDQNEKQIRLKKLQEEEKINKIKNNPCLKQSRSYEIQNKILFSIMWLCFLPIARVIQLFIRTIRFAVGELTFDKFLFYVNLPGLKLLVNFLVSIIFISLIIHRLLGCIVGFFVRLGLRKTLKNNGRYDIHIGWISYRGIFDLNQIVIRDLMWRNPPEFKRTPFLIHCKAIAISFNPMDIFRLIVGQSNRIVFDEIVIDSLQVYFERGN